ncbi:MAG: YraN family protein [Flavobacteriaceae bacterium]
MRDRLALRRAAERRGRRAEWSCLVLLACKGYRPLARRVRTPFGEIDLIASRGGTIVFVEVKHRASEGAALEAVSARQQRRMVDAASWWLARRPRYGRYNLRFDVMAVGARLLPLHLVDAIRA